MQPEAKLSEGGTVPGASPAVAPSMRGRIACILVAGCICIVSTVGDKACKGG